MRIKIKKKTEKLIVRTFVEATLKRRQCPFLRIDRIGSYCAKNFDREGEISDERRNICDYSSMMARCLDSEKYRECMFYTGEELLE